MKCSTIGYSMKGIHMNVQDTLEVSIEIEELESKIAPSGMATLD